MKEFFWTEKFARGTKGKKSLFPREIIVSWFSLINFLNLIREIFREKLRNCQETDPASPNFFLSFFLTGKSSTRASNVALHRVKEQWLSCIGMINGRGWPKPCPQPSCDEYPENCSADCKRRSTPAEINPFTTECFLPPLHFVRRSILPPPRKLD